MPIDKKSDWKEIKVDQGGVYVFPIQCENKKTGAMGTVPYGHSCAELSKPADPPAQGRGTARGT